MATEDNTESATPEAPAADATQRGYFVNRRFLHDLSIENPVGRVSDEDAPNVRLGLQGSVQATPLPAPAAYTVDISLTLLAALAEKTVFVAELTYRVEVELRNIPEAAVGHVLCVDVPTAFFPAIREILMYNGTFAGYPEMQVGDFDFRELYYRQHPELLPA